MTAQPRPRAPEWFTGSPQRWRRLSLDWAFISQGMLWIARLRLASSLGALCALLFGAMSFALWGSHHEAASVCGGLCAFGLFLSFILPLASRSFAKELARRRSESLRHCRVLISQGAISESLLPHSAARRTLEAHVREALARSRAQPEPVITSARATDPSGRSIELDILPPR